MLRFSAAVLLVATLLAGCSGGGGGQTPVDDPVPVLKATDTTGVIRVVVFDAAIRPLGNATVEVMLGPEVVTSKATDKDGFAGFEDLDPGTYFVKARKPLYHEAQQAVEVVAGVDDPTAVKVQLIQRTGDIPFYQEYKIEAFLECSAAMGNWCFIANYYPCLAMQTAGQPCLGNLTADNSFFDIPLTPGRVPDWLQGEMIWESTQAAFTYMSWRFDIDDPETATIEYTPEATGASPLLVVASKERMDDLGLSINSTLAVEAFHAGSPTVCDNDPTGDTLCVYTGAAVEQRFTYIIHAFYGYVPPEGWRFSTEGKVPQPI